MLTNQIETIKHSIIFWGSVCASCVTVVGAIVRVVLWLAELKSDIDRLKEKVDKKRNSVKPAYYSNTTKKTLSEKLLKFVVKGVSHEKLENIMEIRSTQIGALDYKDEWKCPVCYQWSDINDWFVVTKLYENISECPKCHKSICISKIHKI
jgi:hypothetical protein